MNVITTLPPKFVNVAATIARWFSEMWRQFQPTQSSNRFFLPITRPSFRSSNAASKSRISQMVILSTLNGSGILPSLTNSSNLLGDTLT